MVFTDINCELWFTISSAYITVMVALFIIICTLSIIVTFDPADIQEFLWHMCGFNLEKLMVLPLPIILNFDKFLGLDKVWPVVGHLLVYILQLM